LIKAFDGDVPPGSDVCRLHDVRESICGFLVGAILNIERGADLANSIVAIVQKRLRVVLERGITGTGELLVSDMDRTQILAEGLIQYWETKLYLAGLSEKTL